MFHPEIGAVLLVSPKWEIMDFAMLGCGVVFGLLVRWRLGMLSSPATKYLFLGACVWSVSRDCEIPLEIAVFCTATLSFTRREFTLPAKLVIAATTVLFTVFGRAISPPTSTWAPPFLSVVALSCSPMPVATLIIVAVRHLRPHNLPVLYGALLTTSPLVNMLGTDGHAAEFIQIAAASLLAWVLEEWAWVLAILAAGLLFFNI